MASSQFRKLGGALILLLYVCELRRGLQIIVVESWGGDCGPDHPSDSAHSIRQSCGQVRGPQLQQEAGRHVRL